VRTPLAPGTPQRPRLRAADAAWVLPLVLAAHALVLGALLRSEPGPAGGGSAWTALFLPAPAAPTAPRAAGPEAAATPRDPDAGRPAISPSPLAGEGLGRGGTPETAALTPLSPNPSPARGEGSQALAPGAPAGGGDGAPLAKEAPVPGRASAQRPPGPAAVGQAAPAPSSGSAPAPSSGSAPAPSSGSGPALSAGSATALSSGSTSSLSSGSTSGPSSGSASPSLSGPALPPSSGPGTPGVTVPAGGDEPLPTYAVRVPPAFTQRYALRRGGLEGRAEMVLARDGPRYAMSLRGWIDGAEVLGHDSRGGFDGAGFAPERFVERQRGRDRLAANFDTARRRVSYSGPAQTHPYVAGTQDRLSWLVQLAAIVGAEPARFTPGAELVLAVSGARADLDRWRFEVGAPEALALADGRIVTALPLRREPARPYDLRVQVWLDPAHQHLPALVRWSVVPGGAALELLAEPDAARVPASVPPPASSAGVLPTTAPAGALPPAVPASPRPSSAPVDAPAPARPAGGG